MRDMMRAVREFHEKMSVSQSQSIFTEPKLLIEVLGDRMVHDASFIEREGLLRNGDRRYLRAHLLLEECGELVKAMGRGVGEGMSVADYQIAVLDAMADLLYVLVGAAVTYDMPLVEAFWEVHRSNMTKEPQPRDPGRERVRQKGPNYKPPDLQEVLVRYRTGRKGDQT